MRQWDIRPTMSRRCATALAGRPRLSDLGCEISNDPRSTPARATADSSAATRRNGRHASSSGRSTTPGMGSPSTGERPPDPNQRGGSPSDRTSAGRGGQSRPGRHRDKSEEPRPALEVIAVGLFQATEVVEALELDPICRGNARPAAAGSLSARRKGPRPDHRPAPGPPAPSGRAVTFERLSPPQNRYTDRSATIGGTPSRPLTPGSCAPRAPPGREPALRAFSPIPRGRSPSAPRVAPGRPPGRPPPPIGPTDPRGR